MRSSLRSDLAKPGLVAISIEIRLAVTCGIPAKHSAYPDLDNCYRDPEPIWDTG